MKQPEGPDCRTPLNARRPAQGRPPWVDSSRKGRQDPVSESVNGVAGGEGKPTIRRQNQIERLVQKLPVLPKRLAQLAFQDGPALQQRAVPPSVKHRRSRFQPQVVSEERR